MSSSFLFLPGVWLVAFWALVFRARVHLGQWPVKESWETFCSHSPAAMDPRYFALHSEVVKYGFLFDLLAMLFGSVWIFVAILARDRAPALRIRIVFVASLMLTIATAVLDPWGAWTWYFP